MLVCGSDLVGVTELKLATMLGMFLLGSFKIDSYVITQLRGYCTYVTIRLAKGAGSF